MVHPTRLQAAQERELGAALFADPDVQKALQRLEEVLSGRGFPERRRLLGEALRLTRAMAPQVADALAACRDAIGYDAPVELYLRRDPCEAAAVLHDSLGSSSIVLSSWLLEVLTPGELRAVIGHELGHVALEHHRLRPQALGGVNLETMLKLFNWSRWAEISADRVGMICAGEVEHALVAEFKLVSGVSSTIVRPDLESLARQADALAAAPSTVFPSSDDVLSTHPFMAIRARALLLFARSQTCRVALGGQLGADVLPDEALDELVGQDLQQMEANFLQSPGGASSFAKRLLYCAGFSVAGMCGEVDERERSALASLLGADAVEQFARQERSRHGVWPRGRKTLGTAGALAKVRAELEGLLDEARQRVSLANRVHLVQLLCIVARADHEVAPEEIEEMERIAVRLEVDPLVVAQTLRASADPLD